MISEVITVLVINDYFLGNVAEFTHFLWGGGIGTQSMEQKSPIYSSTTSSLEQFYKCPIT
jgi:hypothetical protein